MKGRAESVYNGAKQSTALLPPFRAWYTSQKAEVMSQAFVGLDLGGEFHATTFGDGFHVLVCRGRPDREPEIFFAALGNRERKSETRFRPSLDIAWAVDSIKVEGSKQADAAHRQDSRTKEKDFPQPAAGVPLLR
ncbi:unnamed protein product [Hapterophycus canaliculatus]